MFPAAIPADHARDSDKRNSDAYREKDSAGGHLSATVIRREDTDNNSRRRQGS